ncbi:MAG: phosphopantetheine-binding protein [Alphaproteobacteria bacterium]
MSNVESEIMDIIADKGQVERDLVRRDAKLDELQVDSLGIVEIIFAIEEKYDIQVPYNANDSQAEFDTVGDVIDAVSGLVTGKA